jgi:uncharacterized protein (TIGR02271 family)
VIGRGATGGDESRPLVRHEEEATVDKRWEGVGYARVRRTLERDRVRERYPRQVEQLAHERIPVGENDSGEIETLADGSVSIPLYEEELVVTTKIVLRERVIVRKENVTEWQKVETELRRERVEFDTSDAPQNAFVGTEAFRTRRSLVETKPFFLTSEFFLLALALAGVLITALTTDTVDARLGWMIGVALVAAYALSRGFAKSDTEHG